MLTINVIRRYFFGASLCFAFGLSALSNAAAASLEDTAVFAGGCFWGVDAVFKHIKGRGVRLFGGRRGNRTL
jgi:peptide-methionine (S)-S-oxide reductase